MKYLNRDDELFQLRSEKEDLQKIIESYKEKYEDNILVDEFEQKNISKPWWKFWK